jgi:predicted Rossmann fold flavoprotein
VTFTDGSVLEAAALIIATGGRSVPATGSDGWGLEVVARLGHRVVPTYPALTPLVADPAPHAHLAGVSLEVRLEAPGPRGKTTSRGGFLFTHRGYSGPAVLDVSHAAVRSRLSGGTRQPILACWAEMDPEGWERLLLAHRGAVQALLAKHLPARLAETLCREAGLVEGAPAAQLRREQRRQLVDLLTRYPLPWTGDEGYAKAEVTGGGVDLGEVDRRTLESRLHRGLFLCGEILDAFGPIGGHNFQWAWATGRTAGQGATATRS